MMYTYPQAPIKIKHKHLRSLHHSFTVVFAKSMPKLLPLGSSLYKQFLSHLLMVIAHRLL